MIRSRFVRSVALVLTAAVAISCTDAIPTAPSAPVVQATKLPAPTAAEKGLLSGLLGGVIQTVTHIVGFVADATGLTVHPVKWNDSYANVSHTVSSTITPWGGTLRIPESDFTITFPYGAVSQNTTISITSDPNYVAYKMEPHGIRFAKPVVVTQGLRQTAVYGQPLNSQLFGAYLSDDLLDLSQVLHALEIELSTTIFRSGSSSLPETQVWIINHFSRYMLASG